MDQQQLGPDSAAADASATLTQLSSSSDGENLRQMDVGYLLQEIMTINNLKLDPARENMYILEKWASFNPVLIWYLTYSCFFF